MDTDKISHVLAIDPSGNFNEGLGITGWVLHHVDTDKTVKYGAIDASQSIQMEEHWEAHLTLIKSMHDENPNLVVVCEDYMLYANKATSQINSRMETPKLIGVIQMYCWQNNIPLFFQTAASVKRRWKEFVLVKHGYLEQKEVANGKYLHYYIRGNKINNHVVDALRHAIHFTKFKIKEEHKKGRR